jgi:glyoxylase-like metal-dependent hydrolase (beta-lactamase superfamily II)
MSSSRSNPVICRLCGTHFPPDEKPEACAVCVDVRGLGFAPRGDGRLTTLQELQQGFRLETSEVDAGLVGIGMTPQFAAGHRALVVQTPEGNVMWDCLPIIDDEAVAAVEELGGLTAIAVSHPHFYGAMVEWSRTFGDAPIYVHEADREWVLRPDPAVRYWSGPTQSLPGGLTLIHCAGHFEGAAVLHWPAGADGRGALLSSDPISVTPDRHVTFMYAYPNLIPLNVAAIQRIVKSLAPFDYDRVQGGFAGSVIPRNAKQAVAESAERYIAAIQ